jgi:hypothetical protein
MKGGFYKGYKVMKVTLDIGWEDDDIVKNLFTILIQEYLKSVPRFANGFYKKHKRSKIKNTSRLKLEKKHFRQKVGEYSKVSEEYLKSLYDNKESNG